MKFIYKLTYGFFRLYYRVEITGKEHIPNEGPYIICPNHHHNIDPPLVATIFKEKTYFMAKEELFKNKAMAWLITKFGAFPVHRGGGDKKAIVTSIKHLKNKEPLCIFPEGRRVPIGQAGEIKEGALRIAQKMECPIVPVCIEGNYKPFRKMKIKIKEPFVIGKEDDLKEAAEQLKQLMHR